MKVTFTVNGTTIETEVGGTQTLLGLLRDQLGMTGSKLACGLGDEFTFRFNRRHSQARGLLLHHLLEQAVRAKPRAHGRSGAVRRAMRIPPANKRVRCDSLARESLDRPWRTAQLANPPDTS